jgi:biopolymer transport protein TolR
MAGGMDLGGGGKGGKKPLDVTINLVPFIDLMAVTIVFLIMTAVWTQLGRLQVSNSGQNAGEEPPPTNQQLQPINLLITERELKLSVGGSQLDPITISRDGKDRVDVVKLVEKLKDLKTQQPEQSAITLQPEDAVRYDDLVRIIDTCVGNQFPSVSVSPASTT